MLDICKFRGVEPGTVEFFCVIPKSMETGLEMSDVVAPQVAKISEKLDIARREIEKQIWLDNQTVTDLVVSKMSFSRSFDGLVEFEWDDDYEGEQLKADSDINIFLSIRLTDKGMLVTKPVKLEGSMSIHTFSQEEQLTGERQ